MRNYLDWVAKCSPKRDGLEMRDFFDFSDERSDNNNVP
jgi:hypothetical protein